MEKKIVIEITGLTNSNRAIKDKSIDLNKLVQIAGLSWESIMQNIAFEIEHEVPESIKSTSELVAEAIENVIHVAKAYKEDNYTLKM